MSRTLARYLLDTLAESGLTRIYGIAGDSLNALTEGVRARENFEWVHVRHEEVAAFAAGAEAHLTNHLTVCAGSCGPGNLHLINGLYDCHRSRVPVLAIAAQIPTQELGSNYFQETDPKKVFAGCSHFCELVSKPEQLPRLLKLAVETALSQRGVSVLILPGDIAFKSLKDEIQPLNLKVEIPNTRPSDDKLEVMTKLIEESSKITILAGAGCANARRELLALAEKLKAPIVHALRGKEFIEYENPFDVGMTGLLGFTSGYYAMESCDLLLMLGTDFPYSQFLPTTKKIQVDILGENIGRRTSVDLGVVGDVRETLRSLLPLLSNKTDPHHLEKSLKHYSKAREELDALAETGSLLHPQAVMKTLNEVAAADAIFTCDVGTPTIWAARYLRMNGRRRLLGSFNHGSMANAMPQALGAQKAFPDRQVISLSGDGGFSMLMGDFLTLNQENLPVKVLVFNNSALGFVEMEMMAEGLEQTAVSLSKTNFAALAEAVGIRGYRIEKSDTLKQTLITALNTPGPALIDVVVSPLELSLPPHISMEQVQGFGLFGIKAVLGGHGKELVELVKTSFWR